MIAAVKRWLLAQGFTEKVAVLVMWQAAIILVISLIVIFKIVSSKR